MAEFTHHIFVCGNVREPGHRRGSCDPAQNEALRSAFKKAIKAAGLADRVRANHAGCLDQCEHGPTVVIYPQAVWYGRVQVDDVPRILEETVLAGRVIEELRIPASCINNFECAIRERRPEATCTAQGCTPRSLS
jgi:(2Fe-2S) ferredoxin